MRILPCIAFVVASGLLAGVPVHPTLAGVAGPTPGLSWNVCDPPVLDRSWSGPGDPYELDLSAIGLDQPLEQLDASIRFFPARVVPAWDFSAVDYWTGRPGCQGPARMTALPGGAGCPGYPLVSFGALMFEGSLTSPAPTLLRVSVNPDPSFTPGPGVRYGIVRVRFDHANSIPGPSAGGACGQVEEPMCVVLTEFTLRPAGSAASFTYPATAYVTWQDPGNSTRCPGATPARARTWGGIKDAYR